MAHRSERSGTLCARREIDGPVDLGCVLHREQEAFAVGIEVVDE
jgi:hypothetical protein